MRLKMLRILIVTRNGLREVGDNNCDRPIIFVGKSATSLPYSDSLTQYSRKPTGLGTWENINFCSLIEKNIIDEIILDTQLCLKWHHHKDFDKYYSLFQVFSIILSVFPTAASPVQHLINILWMFILDQSHLLHK